MIIKIISLKESIDRREYIHQQFSKLGLYYDFEDAVDVRSCSKEILNFFSSKNFELLYGRLPSLGEIGCSISHDLARKNFLKINNQKTLMVLEDDAKIISTKDELFSVVKVFEKSKFDILILGFSKCDNEYEKHINIINPVLPTYKTKNKISIGPRYLHSTSGAVAYLVNKQSANIMSNICPKSALADDWKYFSKLGLKIGYTNPMIIRENTTKLYSTLNHINHSLTHKKSEKLLITILLYIRKYIYGFGRITFLYLKHLRK